MYVWICMYVCTYLKYYVWIVCTYLSKSKFNRKAQQGARWEGGLGGEMTYKKHDT